MQAAFFDLDKTILARSSGLALGRDFYREGLISKRLLLRGLAAQIVYILLGADEEKMEKMRQRALELTRGWERAKVRGIVEQVMGDVLMPIVFAEALDLIHEHRDAGRQTFIISSSPEEIVGPFADLLGVDGFIGSRAKVDDEGRYTGDLELYCYGATKAEALRDLAAAEGLDLSECYAYSDSATDLPMLEAVGYPVATNPDKELARIAAERGWEILRFESPVTLRKRLAGMTPPRNATMGVGAAVGFLALAGYVWIRRRPAPRRETIIGIPGFREVRIPLPERLPTSLGRR